LQMSIHPSDAFMASNEEAIRTKNETIAAQNTENIRKAEASQKVIMAKGDADAAIEAAQGRANSATIEAQANRTKLEQEGLGEKAKLNAEISAFGSPQLYIEYLKAQAQLKWNGQQPQIVAGAGASTNLIVPLPSLATPAPAPAPAP
jgi:membrane protease subunit HflC